MEGKGGLLLAGLLRAPFSSCSHSILTKIEKLGHRGLKRSPGVSFLPQGDHYDLLLMPSNIPPKFIIFHLLI